MAADLSAADHLNPKSTPVISGVVTDPHVDSAVPTARFLAARFTLTHDGKAAFEKTLDVECRGGSNVIGAVAIPDAINHCTALVQKLAATLFSDPGVGAAASVR